MIDGLRPYPATASSAADWLPALPSHWELHRAKANFREVDERSLSGDEELLSVSHKTGVTPRSQKNITMFMAESYEGHKTCQPGDIVVNTLWAWMAALGSSRHVGIVSPAYGVYRERGEVAFDPRYLDYLLRTEAYRGEYLRSSRGITTSRLRLYPPDFLNIPFVQPPLDEQQLIVRFLDWHGAMTGKLIRAKRRLIALLNEQKQSIIHRAVTCGLDPAAKLKPSGVDWLGDVPKHWKVLPFHACYAEKSFPNIGMRESIVLSLSYGRIVIKPPEKLFGLVPASFETYQIVDPGDIIIRCTDLQNDKKSLRTGLSGHRGIITSAYLCLMPKKALSCDFAHLILATYDALKIIYGYGSGLRQNLSFKDLKHMPIPAPPREEQPQIIAEIQRQTAEIEQAIQQCTSEIALVAELRTRLIADIATGQLDVRAVAANLPNVADAAAEVDLTDEADLDDDADALIDEEEAA